MQRMLDGGGRGPSSETCTVHPPINSPLSYDDWEYDQIIQSLLSRYGTLGCFSTLKGYESGRRSNKLNCYCGECLLIQFCIQICCKSMILYHARFIRILHEVTYLVVCLQLSIYFTHIYPLNNGWKFGILMTFSAPRPLIKQ